MNLKKNFLFAEKVGVLPRHDEEFKMPISANIELVQNGFQLRYEGKDFNADNIDDALKLIRSWMTMSHDKDEESEHNSDHEND